MAGFKIPTHLDRAAAARAAKEKALEKLKARAAPDPEAMAARAAAAAEKDRAAAAKREARKAEIEAEKAARAEAAEQRRIAEAAKVKPVLTEEELKARRDARYAARKARKK